MPSNIFFGTGIPTIIMVLKKGTSRNDLDDILIIDASKGFVKEGKNNKLRARDIKKIADTYIARQEIPHFSRRVSRQEVRNNDWNLNIPRYVDSSEKADSFDIYATMLGGIPVSEIDELDEYFSVFTGLKNELFTFDSSPYAQIKTEDIKGVIENNAGVNAFRHNFASAFTGLGEDLFTRLVDNITTVQITSEENNITDDIFARMDGIPLVDKYAAYQTLDDNWRQISVDLEVIRSEGLTALTQVDPNMVIKKKDNKEVEVQDGWVGHILPFDIVQEIYFSDTLKEIYKIEQSLGEIENAYEELIEQIPEDEKGGDFLNEDNTAFVPKEVANTVKQYKKSKTLPEAGSVDEIICRASELIEKEKTLKKSLKDLQVKLHNDTKSCIESLSTEQAKDILRYKWINPIIEDITRLPDTIVSALSNRISALTKKYSVSLVDLDGQIDVVENELTVMLDDLTGSEYDMLGIKELQKMLKGGKND